MDSPRDIEAEFYVEIKVALRSAYPYRRSVTFRVAVYMTTRRRIMLTSTALLCIESPRHNVVVHSINTLVTKQRLRP
jgi:hypothetical protein